MERFADMPRKHDDALVLGSGPSINLLKPEHLENLQVETFGLNNFCVHEWLVPDYMQCEVKPHQKEKTQFFVDMLKQKRSTLKNTGFLLAKEDEPTAGRYIPQYFRRLRIPFDGLEPRRPHATYSFGRLLACVNGKGYKTIYLLGFDFYSSEYFWAGRPDLPDFMNFSNVERGYNATSLHRHAKEGILDRIVPYIKKNGIRVVNLAPDSMLADYLPTRPLP